MANTTAPAIIGELSDCGDFAAARARLGELRHELVELRAAAIAKNEEWKAVRDHPKEAGEAYLAGDGLPVDREALAQQWRALDRRIRVVEEALRIHEMSVFAPARARAAAELGEKNAKAYSTLLRDVAAAAQATLPSLEVVVEFETAFREAGGDARALPKLTGGFEDGSVCGSLANAVRNAIACIEARGRR